MYVESKMFDKEKDKIIKALRAKHKINKFFMSVQNNLWIAGVVVCIALVFYILGDRLSLNVLTTVGFCLMGVDLVYLFFIGRISRRASDIATRPQMENQCIDDPILCPYCEKELLVYVERGKQDLMASNGMFFGEDKYYGKYTCPRCHHDSELQISQELYHNETKRADKDKEIAQTLNDEQRKKIELKRLDEIDKECKKNKKEK